MYMYSTCLNIIPVHVRRILCAIYVHVIRHKTKFKEMPTFNVQEKYKSVNPNHERM